MSDSTPAPEKFSYTTQAKIPLRFEIDEIAGCVRVLVYCDRVSKKAKPVRMHSLVWMEDKGLLHTEYCNHTFLYNVGLLPSISKYCERMCAAWRSNKPA